MYWIATFVVQRWMPGGIVNPYSVREETVSGRRTSDRRLRRREDTIGIMALIQDKFDLICNSPEQDFSNAAKRAVDSLEGVEESVEGRRHHRPHPHRHAYLVVRTKGLGG